MRNPKGKDLNLKHPSIGSGKITRRVYVIYQVNPRARIPRRSKTAFTNPSSHKSKKVKPIKFPNEAVKIIFLYWNRFGHPFVQHRPIWNKTTTKSVERINLAIKRYGRDEIMKSMDRLHIMFSSSWFKHRLYFSKTKITLPDFFYYEPSRLEFARKGVKSCPRSWMKECFKGNNYLKNKHDVILKDRKPKITGKLLEIWKEYDQGAEITSGVKNNIIKCAHILSKFSRVNDINPITVIEVIENALLKWQTFKPKHTGYLQNELFWNEQLPKELIRYGAIEKEDRIIRVL